MGNGWQSLEARIGFITGDRMKARRDLEALGFYETLWDHKDLGMFSRHFERLMFVMGCWSKPDRSPQSVSSVNNNHGDSK